MAKSGKKLNEVQHSMDGCYGEIVQHSSLHSFLRMNFQMNDVIQQAGGRRFAQCIWGHAGIGKCVSGDTIIRTADDGYIPIERLFLERDMEPDSWATPDNLIVETRKGMAKVERLYFSGEKPALRIKTNFGRELTGSLVHPVLTLMDNGFAWTEMSNLRIGDVVVVRGGNPDNNKFDDTLPPLGEAFSDNRCKVDFSVPDQMTPDLAFILGALVGEGSCSNQRAVNFCQDARKQLAESYVSACRNVFGLVPKVYQDERTDYTCSFCIHRVLLRRWLADIGLDYFKSGGKEIPWSIMRISSANCQKAFLKALYEAEGCNEISGISISSASEKLLRQVSLLLLQWDIQASLRTKNVKGTNYFILSALGENGRKLNEIIGFSRSNGDWTVASANPNRGLVPVAWALPFLRSMKRSHLSSGGKLSKKLVHSHPLNLLYNKFSGREGVSVETVRKVAALLLKAGRKYKNTIDEILQCRYERIVSIEDVGTIPLYDVTIPEGSEFLANGFVVHNTDAVKDYARRPVNWRGTEYPGYEVHDVPIAQFEEMGDLHGLPIQTVPMRNNGETAWVNVDMIEDYRKLGFEADTRDGLTSRTVYAPPDWAVFAPGPSILLLDDWNRSSQRILKGIMQLLQDYKMMSWSLPPGCNIVLTGNPDEQDYLVTSIDDAILTRIKHITLEQEAKEWAVWAASEKLDSRGINFVLMYPQMMLGKQRTNPRTLAEFFRVLKHFPSIEDAKSEVALHAHSLLDEETVASFVVCATRDMRLVVEPEEILNGEDGKVEYLRDIIDEKKHKDPRIDIFNVCLERLFAVMVQPDCKFTEKRRKNFINFIKAKWFPEEMRHAFCHRFMAVMKEDGADGLKCAKKWVGGDRELTNMILETFRGETKIKV